MINIPIRTISNLSHVKHPLLNWYGIQDVFGLGAEHNFKTLCGMSVGDKIWSINDNQPVRLLDFKLHYESPDTPGYTPLLKIPKCKILYPEFRVSYITILTGDQNTACFSEIKLYTKYFIRYKPNTQEIISKNSKIIKKIKHEPSPFLKGEEIFSIGTRESLGGFFVCTYYKKSKKIKHIVTYNELLPGTSGLLGATSFLNRVYSKRQVVKAML